MNNDDSNVKIKLYNRISFRVYLYFAFIVCLFATILGTILKKLSQKNYKETNLERLINKGESVAEVLNRYIVYENEDEGSLYLKALEKLETSKTDDIWIVSDGKPANPMNELGLINTEDISDLQLNENDKYVLSESLAGKRTDRVYYNEIFNETRLSVGIPVYDSQRNVVGAVLLFSAMKEQTKLIKTSYKMILYSALVALVVCFIAAIVFARNITKPISKMRTKALGLAEGDYSQKIDSNQKDELGDLARTFDILSDRLAQSEEERKNMEKMRMDFFANVSHELRTPITVMRAYTEMLIDGIVTEPEKIMTNYNRMLSECKGMERLVGDLLLLSKMQNPDFEVEKEPINLIQIFDDIARNATAICSKKNIQLSIEKDSDHIMMFGDYDRLRQMFMVIFDNAVKFSNVNSTIYIKITCMDTIRISIKDEGVGISKEELPYIFDKFYKSKLRQNASGTGLGLAIARQIALKHGGTIQVNSELGHGTEFVFSFSILTDYEISEEESEVAATDEGNVM